MSPEDVAKIAADYEAGVPIRRGRGLQPDEVDEAVVLYRGGWSAARLGKKYRVSGHTVRAALCRQGVDLRRRGGPKTVTTIGRVD